MFKGRGNLRKPPKLSSRQAEPTPNWLLEIPAKLDLTKEQLQARKAFDQRRWHCMVKCSDPKDRIAASVASVWNYFFSTKGVGQFEPLKLAQTNKVFEDASTKYQTEDEYQRAQVTLKCFETLCKHFKVEASGEVFLKPSRPNPAPFNEEKDLP